MLFAIIIEIYFTLLQNKCKIYSSISISLLKTVFTFIMTNNTLNNDVEIFGGAVFVKHSYWNRMVKIVIFVLIIVSLLCLQCETLHAMSGLSCFTNPYIFFITFTVKNTFDSVKG